MREQVTPVQVPKHKPRIGFWGLIKHDYRDKGLTFKVADNLLFVGIVSAFVLSAWGLLLLTAAYPVFVISFAGSAVVLFLVFALSSWYARLKEKYNV